MRDYQDGSVYVMGLGKMDKTPISGSNVLYFELDDGCSFIVRPSGTEPKIKVYILGVGATRGKRARAARAAALNRNISALCRGPDLKR